MKDSDIDKLTKDVLEYLKKGIKKQKDLREEAKANGINTLVSFFDGSIQSKEHCVSLLEIALGIKTDL